MQDMTLPSTCLDFAHGLCQALRWNAGQRVRRIRRAAVGQEDGAFDRADTRALLLGIVAVALGALVRVDPEMRAALVDRLARADIHAGPAVDAGFHNLQCHLAPPAIARSEEHT